MKKIYLLVLFLLPSLSLLATIRIISTTPANATCNGSLVLEATGTAGPFTLKITHAGGYVLEKAMNGTTESITGLCSGEYTVQVFNAFGCAKTLLAQVGVSAASLDASVVSPAAAREYLVSSQLKARAFPNPFQDEFQVEVEWDSPIAEVIKVEVYNALGQLIQVQGPELVLGRNRFNIQLHHAASRGLLQVLLRDKKGRQVVLKVMQVRE